MRELNNNSLNSPIILHFLGFPKIFIIHVDAIKSGVFLAQQNGAHLSVVAYFSQRLTQPTTLFRYTKVMLRSRSGSTAPETLLVGETH